MNRTIIAVQTDGRTVQGNERQLAILAAGLVARGIDLHISAVPDTPTWDLLAGTGATMTAIRPRGALDLVAAWRFSRWLRALKPAALLITSWRRMPLAARAAQLAGVPRVALRLGMVHRPRGKRYRRALRRRIDAIIVNSTTVRDHVIGTFPGSWESRVYLVANAAGDTTAPPPGKVREALSIPAGAPLVVAVGGLSRRKGFDILLDAFATSPSDAHLLICGTGSEHETLLSQSASLNLQDRVHFLGQRDDVPAVLAACDVFVMSSHAEGFSVALLEAMCAGLPIIATDIGGTRDALGDDEAGWIVPPNDVDALAGALTTVLCSLDTVATKKRAAEASRRATEVFSVDAMVDGVLQALTV